MESNKNERKKYFFCYNPNMLGALIKCGKTVHHTEPNPSRKGRIMWAFENDGEIETIVGIYVSHSGQKNIVMATYRDFMQTKDGIRERSEAIAAEEETGNES